MARDAGLWEQIVFRARQRPHALAALTPGGPISYQMLVRDVDGMATELLGLGLTPRDMVAIHMTTSYRHLRMILALDRAGVPSTSFASLEAVRDRPGVAAMALTAIVSSEPAPDDAPCRWITLPERGPSPEPDPARLAAVERPADAPIRILWSSGSTGGAKGAILTRGSQAARIGRVRFARTYSTATRHFPAMPWSTSYGYHVALAVLSAGGAIVLPQPGVDFITLANATGVTAVGGSPGLLRELLGPASQVGRRLDTVTAFDLLGANLPSQLAQRARFFLTPNLWSVYGMSEVGWVATADAAVCIADSSAVGHVIPSIEVQIVDAADQPLAAGQEGFVRVRSPQAATGYYNNPDATARLFRDGWFHPGDVGTLEPSGLLRITGRVEDMIVRDGAATAPLPLEEAIRALPAVHDAAVFAVPVGEAAQQICAALVLDAGADAESVFARVREALGARAPERMFTIEVLPRSDSGKVLRRLLVEGVLRGART